MSTKNTLLHTSSDEHWYAECSEYIGRELSNPLYLEIDKSNVELCANTDEYIILKVTNQHSDIYKLLTSEEFRIAGDTHTPE